MKNFELIYPLATIKFTNKLRSYGTPHFKNPPKNTCFELELLQPCSKKEDPVTLRQKGLETIAILSQDNFAIAYTDGSSDRSLSNGEAGIILLLPDVWQNEVSGLCESSERYPFPFLPKSLPSHFPKDHSGMVLIERRSFLLSFPGVLYSSAHVNNYSHYSWTKPEGQKTAEQQKKSCILQWIPAHVNIEGNECADSLAKEARSIEHTGTTIRLDANAVAKHRIMNNTFKKPLVTEFDCPRIITSTTARLRTEHLKGTKIHPDKTRSYVQCKHCPDLQLTPKHILECPTVATKTLKIGMVPLRDSLRELLYSPDAPRIAEAVIKTFDGI
ncbi:RNase H domain-containing protein [Trichonephila clavipes]|nr:RNase H domain-containing protein [Trichonephila clavipes]